VVWTNGKNYLIDGHHRKKVIDRNKIKDYRVIKLKFDNKDEVQKWIIDNQLGKRNVTSETISYLRGLRYKLQKKSRGGDNANSQNVSLELSNKYKVSEMTIFRDLKYTDALDTLCSKYDKREQLEIKNKILSRQTNLSKKDILDIVESKLGIRDIRQVISGDKELWQVKLEIERKRKKRKKKPVRIILPKEIKMYHGDCIDVMKKMEKNSVDAGLIDPPYGIGMMNQEWDNFKPSEIDKYQLLEQAYFVGDRSPALKAGLYDLSYKGGKKYEKWCKKWSEGLLRVVKPGGVNVG